MTLLATAASLVLLWGTGVPLGVPGEWEWPRLSYSDHGIALAAIMVGLSAAAYVGFAWLAERGLESAGRLGMFLRLMGLVVVGFGWLWGVQGAAIDGIGLGKSSYVLFYPGPSGYFWRARYVETSLPTLLSGYEELLAERDYLHIGTHPPGLIAGWWLLLDVCHQSPGLVAAAEATMPESVANSFELIRSSVRRDGREFNRADAACLWIGILGTQGLAALTVVPLYLWLRLRASRRVAWWTVLFWPLVPAVAVFLPKSDVLFPCLGMLTAWSWRWAWLRGHLWPGLLAGLTFAAGMLLSLAFLPIAALIGVQTLCDGWPGSGRGDAGVKPPDAGANPRGPVRWSLVSLLLVAGLIGFALPVAGMLRAGVNLLNVWRLNFENHALFYDHNVRTWWKWVLVNPLELALAVGVPVLSIAIVSGMTSRPRSRFDWSGLRSSGGLAVAIVWGLLWLSGKNMGEAGRLWICLMPWVVAAGSGCWSRMTDDRSVAPLPNTLDAASPRRLGPAGCCWPRSSW
ncbi:MAG: hypothetical protein R3B90_00925 [Planctomycetaceae bacterium]